MLVVASHIIYICSIDLRCRKEVNQGCRIVVFDSPSEMLDHPIFAVLMLRIRIQQAVPESKFISCFSFVISFATSFPESTYGQNAKKVYKRLHKQPLRQSPPRHRIPAVMPCRQRTPSQYLRRSIRHFCSLKLRNYFPWRELEGTLRIRHADSTSARKSRASCGGRDVLGRWLAGCVRSEMAARLFHRRRGAWHQVEETLRSYAYASCTCPTGRHRRRG
jgi:hypothetical protein